MQPHLFSPLNAHALAAALLAIITSLLRLKSFFTSG